MHSAGVGHLDLKPSNVVLRRDEQAVLVDFGLAGRHIRPGLRDRRRTARPRCGARSRGARDLSPTKADVYAFGCVAFETLTGEVLFQADTEMAQIARHVAHDGFAASAARAGQAHGRSRPLTELLVSTLRQDPVDRPTAATVRKELARIAPLARPTLAWPLGDDAEAMLEPVDGSPDPDGGDCVALRPLLPPRAEHGAPARARTRRASSRTRRR